jgi:hypothetical protein
MSTLKNGLVRAYNFNNSSVDLSGNHTSVPTAITYGVGIKKEAAVFNGTTSKVFIGRPYNLSAGSISIWVNPANLLINKRYIADAGGYVYIQSTGSDVRFEVFGYAVLSYGSIPLNTWTHLVAAWGSSLKIYKNSLLVGQGTFSGLNAGVNNFDVHIGSGNFPTGFMTGLIDATYVWNRELTQAEVTTLYAQKLEYPFVQSNFFPFF